MAEHPIVEDNDLKLLRLISLVAETSKECVLKLFYSHLKKENLSVLDFVSSCTPRLEELKKKGIFTLGEVERLKCSDVNPENFDVRLICLLLQHLTPDPNRASHSDSLQGSLAVPDDDDFSILAELRRIQICKNRIMHQATIGREVDVDEFEQLFSEVQDTCIRILKQAKSSKEDINGMRKKMNALKNSTMEDLQGNILQNVLQCVRWSWGDMDGIQTRLESAQMEMASSQYDVVDAGRVENLSQLQEDVSSLITEVQSLTVVEDTKQDAPSKENQSIVQQLEASRQHLAAVCETMQENAFHFLSRAPLGKHDSLESERVGHDVQQQSSVKNNEPTGDPLSTVEEKELLELSREIGPDELHALRINLDFEKAQMTRLNEAYPQFSERVVAMLKAWHDTVVACGQNPRKLLAVALQESGNRLLAIKLVPGNELDGIVNRVAHENTKNCIKKIAFSKPVENQGQPAVINYGAPGAINVYGGELTIGGTLAIGTDMMDGGLPAAARGWPSSLIGSPGSHSSSRSDLRPTSSSASIHNFAQPHALNIMGGRVTTTPGSYIALGPNMTMWSPPVPVGAAKGDSIDSVPNRRGYLKKEFDDSLTQTMMGVYLQIMKSVGAIMCFNGVKGFNEVKGTGFRVGTRYIATAWHVISGILDPKRSGNQDVSKLQQAYIVFSDFPHDPSANKYRFTNLYYYDQDLDVSILEISNVDDGLMPNNLTLRKELLCRADTAAVSLIGYGHPNPKNPNKCFEYRCPVVDSGSQAVLAAQAFVRKNSNILKVGLLENYYFSVVDEGYNGYDAPYRMMLHCFMENGASGSPILACLNPAAGIVEVVGILTCGMPEFFFCLKDEFRYMLPNKYRFEAGSKMSYLHENMQNKLPDLARDLFRQ